MGFGLGGKAAGTHLRQHTRSGEQAEVRAGCGRATASCPPRGKPRWEARNWLRAKQERSRRDSVQPLGSGNLASASPCPAPASVWAAARGGEAAFRPGSEEEGPGAFAVPSRLESRALSQRVFFLDKVLRCHRQIAVCPSFLFCAL